MGKKVKQPATLKSWVVFSADTEGVQVFVDIVAAASSKAAEQLVARFRPYAAIDGAEELHGYAARMAGDAEKSASEIAHDWEAMVALNGGYPTTEKKEHAKC